MRTFLINMYKSSGSSGARPINHSVSHDRTEAFERAFLQLQASIWGAFFFSIHRSSLVLQGTVPFDFRIRRMRLPIDPFVSNSFRRLRVPLRLLLTGDNLDLGNAVGVTEDDTNLRGGSTLTGELANLVDDLLGGGLQPGGSGARVGDGGGRHALALAVKSTHVVGVVVLSTAEKVSLVVKS